jgi:hypothetical protein
VHPLHPSLIKHRGRLPLSRNHLQQHPPAGLSTKVTLLQVLLCKITTSYLIPRTATSRLDKIEDLKERFGTSQEFPNKPSTMSDTDKFNAPQAFELGPSSELGQFPLILGAALSAELIYTHSPIRSLCWPSHSLSVL